MNLFDCRVPYFAIPETVLRLRTKSSLQTALTIYRISPERITADEIICGETTPYQRRVWDETVRELLYARVLVELDGEVKLVSLDMEADRSVAKDRIVLPCKINFDALSMNALKVLLTLYALNRYSRTPFQLRLTQTELAEKAGVAERRLRDALAQLVDQRLITIWKQWKAASKITLLEPESGVELFHIGDFYRRHLDSIAVHQRYWELLRQFDPRDHLKDIHAPVTGYTVHCPFCRRGMNGEPSFRFDSTEEGDHWTCFRCKRSGDSGRLWKKLFGYQDRLDWRTVLADCTGTGGEQC